MKCPTWTAVLLLSAALNMPAAATSRSAWLDFVPAPTDNADTAHAEWRWIDGRPEPGPGWRRAAEELEQLATRLTATAVDAGGSGRSTAPNMQLPERYRTPEGQAALQKLTPAERIMMFDQLQRQAAADVTRQASQQERELAAMLASAVAEPARERLLAQAQSTRAATDREWEHDHAAALHEEASAVAELPACRAPHGDAAPKAVRDQRLRGAERRLRRARPYLARHARNLHALRETLGPEIAQAERATDAWNRLDDADLKQRLSAQLRTLQGNALSDAGLIVEYGREVSRHAAELVAARKRIEAGDGVEGCGR